VLRIVFIQWVRVAKYVAVKIVMALEKKKKRKEISAASLEQQKLALCKI
jgi:hypothetical protein